MQKEELGREKLTDHHNTKKYVVITFETKTFYVLPFLLSNTKLRKNKEYDLNEFQKLQEMSEICLYIKKLLKKKVLSSYEVKTKAHKKFDESLYVDETVSTLQKNGILNDKKYAYVYRNFLDLNNYGKYYIVEFLTNKRVDNEIIETLVFDDEKELEKAKGYYTSIKNFYVSSNPIKQKKNLYEQLLKRGFAPDIILKTLSSLNVDKNKEEKMLYDEYDKVKNKLLKKGNTKNLENKIINNLISKGFMYEDILKVIEKEKEEDKDND